MLLLNETSIVEELMPREEPTVVDVGPETHPSSRVFLPTVVQLQYGIQDTPKPEKVDTEYQSAMDMAGKIELESLLSRYEEYKDSATYLAKVSSLAVACGQLDIAREYAQQAVLLNDNNESSKYRLAEVAMYEEEITTAASIFKELAKTDHLLSCLRMVELSVTNSDFRSAQGWLSKAIRIDETDWRVQMLAGTLALIQGNSAKAIRYFRAALDERPRSVQLYYYMALGHILAGHNGQALKALRKAVGLNPFEKKALMAWTDLCVHEKMGFDNVSVALTRYLELIPNDKPTIERLAYILLEKNDKRTLGKLLGEARKHSDDASVSNNLGVLAFRSRNVSLAVIEFQRAIELAENQIDIDNNRVRTIATANLVNSLLDLKQYKAVEHISWAFLNSNEEKSLLVDEFGNRIAEGLVRALENLRKLDQAVSLAEGWIAKQTHPDLHTSLAAFLVCNFTLKDIQLDKAYHYALESYELQRNEPQINLAKLNLALNNLVFTLIEMNELDEAKNYISHFRSDSSDLNTYSYATRGFLAIRLGQVEKGQSLYQKAMLSVQNNMKGTFRIKLNWELGRHYLAMGDGRKAKRFLQKVVKERTEGVWSLDHLRVQAKNKLAQLS